MATKGRLDKWSSTTQSASNIEHNITSVCLPDESLHSNVRNYWVLCTAVSNVQFAKTIKSISSTRFIRHIRILQAESESKNFQPASEATYHSERIPSSGYRHPKHYNSVSTDFHQPAKTHLHWWVSGTMRNLTGKAQRSIHCSKSWGWMVLPAAT